MKKTETTEDLLQNTLAHCAEGIAACLANADKAKEPDNPYFRANEMNYALALLNASARLGGTLARLRGETRTIRVIREAPNHGSMRGESEAPAIAAAYAVASRGSIGHDDG